MSQQNNSPESQSSTGDRELKDGPAQSEQPESATRDRQDQMSVRQSAPTNPRVNDKPEAHQEEA